MLCYRMHAYDLSIAEQDNIVKERDNDSGHDKHPRLPFDRPEVQSKGNDIMTWSKIRWSICKLTIGCKKFEILFVRYLPDQNWVNKRTVRIKKISSFWTIHKSQTRPQIWTVLTVLWLGWSGPQTSTKKFIDSAKTVSDILFNIERCRTQKFV